mmetsp:Transcript_54941/g.152154  ORF Transcript_54941/g.152154 Transcript_54941/m.152154 type:complete len:216 (+) Transcript_54941:224-871(+)
MLRRLRRHRLHRHARGRGRRQVQRAEHAPVLLPGLPGQGARLSSGARPQAHRRRCRRRGRRHRARPVHVGALRVGAEQILRRLLRVRRHLPGLGGKRGHRVLANPKPPGAVVHRPKPVVQSDLQQDRPGARARAQPHDAVALARGPPGQLRASGALQFGRTCAPVSCCVGPVRRGTAAGRPAVAYWAGLSAARSSVGALPRRRPRGSPGPAGSTQ